MSFAFTQENSTTIHIDESQANLLLRSAKSYYEYLDSNNLGLDEIRIVRAVFENDIVLLQLSRKLFSQEGLILEFGEQRFELAEHCDMSFDQDKLILEIAPNFALLNALQNLFTKTPKTKQQTKQNTPIPFRLFSDLKFLVKNVAEFIAKHQDSLSLPSKKPLSLKEIPPYLNDYQKQALQMVFDKPLSYVWGPPGSGKTQVVLFESLLWYAKNGLRTCVLAPTNSALEQIFSTLIENFKKHNFELSNLLRIGMPTQKFLRLYPECCDPNLVNKKNASSLFIQGISLKNRLKESLIVGLTLDGFIKRFDSLGVEFEHFFLDECAFAPLAKACTLCTQNVPISLFGDHKQLMPICEMPPKDIAKQKEVNLWNLSALFMEEFLNKNPLALLNKNPTQTPNITHISTLRYTHRYGDNLAKILDTHIYGIGLQGQERQMEILCLDCGKKSELDCMVSMNEVQGVVKLYTHLMRQSKDKANFSVGIITPFVRQKKELLRLLPSAEISTIHGSQGREWETVIFSPVGLHYHLTDSKQINALFGLNVAISRIKKQLFIVCDRGFWQTQREQFLTQLLHQAQILNI